MKGGADAQLEQRVKENGFWLPGERSAEGQAASGVSLAQRDAIANLILSQTACFPINSLW